MTEPLHRSILKISLCHSQDTPNSETLKNLVQQVRRGLSGHFKSLTVLAPKTNFEFNQTSVENAFSFQ